MAGCVFINLGGLTEHTHANYLRAGNHFTRFTTDPGRIAPPPTLTEYNTKDDEVRRLQSRNPTV